MLWNIRKLLRNLHARLRQRRDAAKAGFHDFSSTVGDWIAARKRAARDARSGLSSAIKRAAKAADRGLSRVVKVIGRAIFVATLWPVAMALRCLNVIAILGIVGLTVL